MADKNTVPYWALPEPATPAPPKGETSASDWLGVTTRAIAPYATAAGFGAAAGAPFAGVGAAPGAAGGVASLGLSDLGTAVYNLATPLWGGERVPLPSETIQNLYGQVGIGTAPKTREQQVFSDVLQAATGGGAQAMSARNLANIAKSPQARNWMAALAANPRGQIGAAAGGAAAPSIAANYFGITDPLALMGLSLAGGGAGAKMTTPKVKVPTVEDLGARAAQAYKQAEAAGVRVAQPELNTLFSGINSELGKLQYIAGNHPEVRRQLAIIQNEFKGPMSLERLDKLHSDIASKARTITNDRTRLLMETVAHKLDDFIDNLSPAQTTAGNARGGVAALTKAQQLYRSKKQLTTVDDAITAARNRAQANGTPLGQNLRSEFSKILNNKRLFGRLSPEVQDAVKSVATGTPMSRGLNVVGALSPLNRNALAAELLAGFGMWSATQHVPSGVLAAGTLAAAGGGAKMAANRMVMPQAQRARAVAAGMPIPYKSGVRSVRGQQVLQAPQTGERAKQRKDVYEIPWWAKK